jgi:hypothetical protein
MNYNIIFVCQKGLLEILSLLLACSLRKFLKINYKLIAAIPNQFGELDKQTENLLNLLEIEKYYIVNDFDPVYPVGNKMFALNYMSDVSHNVFIDSDIICCKNFTGEFIEQQYDLTAFSAPKYNYLSHKEWFEVFKYFNIYIQNTFKHIRSPFLVVKNKSNLCKEWITMAKSLYNSNIDLINKRKIGQLSLSVLVHNNQNIKIYDFDNNLLCQDVTQIYNYNKKLNEIELPYFVCLQRTKLFNINQKIDKKFVKNENSLALYDKVRSAIYEILTDYPMLDQHPLWPDLYKLYFSHDQLSNEDKERLLIGAENKFRKI